MPEVRLRISSPRRLLAISAAASVAAGGMLSCLDDGSGPHYGTAQFSVQPVFQSTAAKIIPVSKARFVITRVPSGALALDTVLAIAAGQDSVDLGLRVVLLSTNETFNLTIALIGPAGDTVFRGGPLAVTAQSGAGAPPTAVPVPIVYSGTGANAASVKFAVHDTALFAGDTVTLAAAAYDKAGVVIPNTPIVFISLDTTKLTVPSALTGKVVGRLARGKANLQALLLTGLADSAHVAVQPLPSAIAATPGDTQKATVTAALANPIQARVTAADLLGVSGVFVKFVAGAGTVSPDSALTDSTGVAKTTWTLGTKSGFQNATATNARIPAGPAATALFTAIGNAGPVDSLAISTGNGQSALVGVAVSTPPAVIVKDHYGNPVSGAAVLFTVLTGGGSVAGGNATTNASGIATVTSWTLGSVVGSNTLLARAFRPHPPVNIDTLAVTFTAGATSAPPAAIALVSGQAQTDTIGAPLAAPLTVKVSDQFSNPVAGSLVSFAVTSGGGSVSAPTATTNASGIASVTWTLGTAAGAGGVNATLTGVTGSPVAFTSTAQPGKSAALAFSVQPPASTAGKVVMTPAMQVSVNDRGGNAVTSSTAPVTLAIHAGTGKAGALLAGTLTRAAVAGVATFNDITIDSASTTFQLDATSAGLTTATSTAFTITAPIVAGGFHWIAATNNWGTAANWNRGTVPGINDTVFIDANGTYAVTVDVAAHVRFLFAGNGANAPTVVVQGPALQVDSGGTFATGSTLNISGGTLSGIALVTISGSLSWTGGTMQDSGLTRINAGATAILSGTLSKGLTNRTFDNAGTLTFLGSGAISAVGTIHKASILNEATGTWDFQGPTITVGGGTAEFVNAGTVKKSGAGTLTLGIAYTSTGTTLIQAGTLELTGNPNKLAGGMTFSAGTDMLLSTNNDSLFHGFAVSGGRVRVTGATVVTTMVTPDTATFKVLDFQSGTMSGVGIMQMTDSLLWTGGTMAGLGTTFIPTTAKAVLSGANAKFINDRKLENAGTFNFGGSNVLQVNGAGQTMKFVNRSGSVFDVQLTGAAQNAITVSGGTALFTNFGTVFKSGSAVRATMQIAYVDSGFTSVQVDTLEFTGSPNRHTGQTIFGATAGHQGQLMFTSGADSILKSALFTGPGHVIINGATVAMGLVAGDTVHIPGVALISGNLSGSGVVAIDTLFWTGGSMTGLGGTLLNTGSVTTVSGANAKFITSRKLENGGNFAFGGTNVIQSNGATQAVNIINRLGAVMDLQNATTGAVTFSSSGGTVQFLNKGTFRKSSLSARILMQIAYADSGVTDIQIDTLDFQGNPNRFTGNVTFGNGLAGHPGQLNLITNNDTITTSATFTDPGKVGRININGASVAFGSLASDTVNIRSLTLASGTLQGPSIVAISDTLAWTGGTMGTNGGTTFLRSTAVTQVTSANAKFITGRKLENAGTFNFGGTNVIQSNGATQTVNIINDLGAVMDIQNAGVGSVTFSVSGGTVQFLNRGTFRKSSTSTRNLMQIAYADSGVTDIKVDTLEFQGNPNRFTGNVIFGNGTVGHPGQLYFATNNDTITTSATFTDASKVGRILINGASVAFGSLAADTVNIRSLSLASGTLLGPSIMAISDTLAWTGGTMGTNSGTTFLRSTAVTQVTGANAKLITGRKLENAGTFNFGGTNVIQSNGVTQTVNIINDLGALMDIQNPNQGSITFSSSGGAVQFLNKGTFRKSSTSTRNLMQVTYADSGVTDIKVDTLEFQGNPNRFTGNVIFGNGTVGHPGQLYFATNNDTITTSATFTDASNVGRILINGATVTFGSLAADTVNIRSLAFASGTLQGPSIMAIRDTLAWTGGTMGTNSGTTFLRSTAVTLVTGANAKLITGRQLENAGTFNFGGTNVIQSNGVTQTVNIINRTGALVDLQNTVAGSIAFSSAGGTVRFTNRGTFRKSSSSSRNIMGVAYADSGVTDIQLDTLEFQGASNRFAGTVSTGSTAGHLGAIYFTANDDTLYKSLSITGPGHMVMNAANVFAGLVAADTVSIPILDMQGGTLTGNGVAAIVNGLSWLGGTMNGTGSTYLTATSVDSAYSANAKLLTSRKFDNFGSFKLAGSNVIQVNGSTQAVVMRNESGALFDLTGTTSSATITVAGGAATFKNIGTFRRNAIMPATQTPVVQIAYVDSGTTSIAQDTLAFSGSSVSFAGNVVYGTPTGAPHTLPVLRIDGSGSDTLYKAVSFPDPTVNPGTFQVNGGNISIGKPTDDTVKVPRIVQNTGTIQGPSVLLITDSLLWTSGIMTGIGTTRIDPRARAVLNPPSTVDLNGRAFTNGGSLTFLSANSLRLSNPGIAVALTNEAGATWDFQSSADIFINSGTGHTFVNNGLLKRSAGTGASIITVPFTNTSTGVIDIATDTLSLSAGSNVLGGTIEGTGILLTGAAPSFTGIIDPGATGSGSIGILKIGPNFTPGTSTVLQFDITGTLAGTAGVDYDQLVDSTGVTNSLANFTIKVNAIGTPDFSAQGGLSNVLIRCVTACSAGGPTPILDVTGLPAPPAGDVWILQYLGGNVLLTLFATGPEPEPTPEQIAALSRPAESQAPLAGVVRSFLAGKTQAERQRVFSDALGLGPANERR